MSDNTASDEWPDEFVEVDGLPVRVEFCAGRPADLVGRVESRELHERGDIAGEGLPVSGTNAAKARRLVAAGLTRAEVEGRYGWRARGGKLGRVSIRGLGKS